MRNGAVVLLDALGFKGIWKRFPAEQVMAKLEALSAGAHAVIGSFHQHASSQDPYGMAPRIETAFGSDSIFIMATVGGVEEPILHDWACLLLASYASSALMALAARDAPAFAYRGAMAVGQFEMRQPFVVGAAVDEAAEHEGLADAALVWFAPSAKAALEQAAQKLGPQSSESTNLPSGPSSRAAPERVCQEILATFDESRIGVAVKKQHTQRFLAHALKQKGASRSSAP